jgi:hypothetical protein
MIEPLAASALTGPEEEHRLLDRLESAILDQMSPVEMPVKHTFTPWLYSREIFMPGPQPGRSGTYLTSKNHATEHQFVVLSGVAIVRIPGQEPVRLTAGYVGVTHPGTRRALYIEEDCRWITFHPLFPEEEAMRQAGATDEELVAAIESRIISRRERADGRDVHREYLAALEGARELKE